MQYPQGSARNEAARKSGGCCPLGKLQLLKRETAPHDCMPTRDSEVSLQEHGQTMTAQHQVEAQAK